MSIDLHPVHPTHRKRVLMWCSVAALCMAVILFLVWLRPTPEIRNFPPKNEVVVAFGDSLVEGVGATPGKDFVSLLSQQIGTPIINLGISGNTTAQGLARIEDVLEYDPGTVIVLLGGNDYLKQIPSQQTFYNLEKIIDKIQESGAVVILLGVRGGLLRDHFSDSFAALAEKTHSLYVPDVLDGLVGHPSLMSDSIHPNDAGYAKIAARIAPKLRALLK